MKPVHPLAFPEVGFSREEEVLPLELWCPVAQTVANASGLRVVLQAAVLEPSADDPNVLHAARYRDIAGAEPPCLEPPRSSK